MHGLSSQLSVRGGALSYVQLPPESRDSGFDASHRPGMTELSFAALLAMTAALHLVFGILNTPLAMAIQRLSTVTSVVMKIRLRVVRTTCGLEIRVSPILPASTKWVSSCTVASVGLPIRSGRSCRRCGPRRSSAPRPAPGRGGCGACPARPAQIRARRRPGVAKRPDQMQKAGCFNHGPAVGFEFSRRPCQSLRSVLLGHHVLSGISSNARRVVVKRDDRPFDHTTGRNIAARCAAFARLPASEPVPALNGPPSPSRSPRPAAARPRCC